MVIHYLLTLSFSLMGDRQNFYNLYYRKSMWEKLFLIFAMLGTLVLLLKFVFSTDMPDIMQANFYLIMGIDLALVAVFYLLSIRDKE